jgi:hypothetical protein
MLPIGRAGQGQHADLHGESKHQLRKPHTVLGGHGPHFGIGEQPLIGSQQREPLVDDAVSPADRPHIPVPPQRRITAILHHHRLMRRFARRATCQLIRRHVADADQPRLPRIVQRLDGGPDLPIRIAPSPRRPVRAVQDVGVQIVRVKMRQRAVERLLSPASSDRPAHHRACDGLGRSPA